jgi:hypothetical protein
MNIDDDEIDDEDIPIEDSPTAKATSDFGFSPATFGDPLGGPLSGGMFTNGPSLGSNFAFGSMGAFGETAFTNNEKGMR